MTDHLVHRVAIRDGVARGIVVVGPGGQETEILARQEVILSAGAVGSPHLLMLSGVGPAEALEPHGIQVVADRRGVGRNLNDHPDYVLKWRCKQPVSVWPDTHGPRRAMAGLRWLLNGTGSAATNHFDTVAAVRSRAGIEYPDLQFTLAPIAMEGTSWTPIADHTFQIHVGLMRAHSRGEITLNSASPTDAPRILCNYLSDPADIQAMVRGVKLVREIAAQPAFDPYRGEEIEPGDTVQSDEEIAARLREMTVSQWHLSCTARMGASDDPDTVVDLQGRVLGVKGLRVVDASIMPEVVNANTNATTIMIAEKIADAILDRPAAAPMTGVPETTINPEWAVAQR